MSLSRARLAVLACALSLAGLANAAPQGEQAQAQATITQCLVRPEAACVTVAEAECLRREGSRSSAAQEDCAIAERDAWNRLLGPALSSAVHRLDDAKVAARLRAAQAAWLSWRTQEVAVIAQLTVGGTIQDTAAARRSSQITAARVRELNGMDAVLDSVTDEPK
jgi:uncharacterized protein YecT (DUF1311 family)